MIFDSEEMEIVAGNFKKASVQLPLLEDLIISGRSNMGSLVQPLHALDLPMLSRFAVAEAAILDPEVHHVTSLGNIVRQWIPGNTLRCLHILDPQLVAGPESLALRDWHNDRQSDHALAHIPEFVLDTDNT
jgi:hypothetical protein